MKMQLKRKNKSKKRKIFFLLILLIYFSSFIITVKIHFKDKSKIIKFLIENNNSYIKNKDDKQIVTKVVSYIANVDFNNPLTLINNNYDTYNKVVKKVNKTVKEKDIVKEIKAKPIVYLYNTHQTEEYSLSNHEIYNIKPTVMTLSYILKEELNKNNIYTIVEENDVSDILNINNWNYAASYKVSRMLMEEAKSKNNSLKYFIDLHRDSVNKKISTININNKNYAKVLFIVGLENPNYLENLKVTENINNMINNKYPNLSRGIYKKKGKGVNGVYNQDFNANTILIEVGAEENTIDEVYNTALVISDILIEYIRNDLNEK